MIEVEENINNSFVAAAAAILQQQLLHNTYVTQLAYFQTLSNLVLTGVTYT